MSNITLDFETTSQTDLKTHGSMKYLKDSKADIVCLGYKIEGSPTELWIPGHPLPEFMRWPEKYKYYAFNAQFDLRVWNILGKKYGYPKLLLNQWVDVMALCGRFTYHQSLAQAGADLELKMLKGTRGKALMKKINAGTTNQADMFEFYDYCKRDVDSTYEMIQALPASALSVDEQLNWEMTARMNHRGLPIDVESAKQILKVTEAYKLEMNKLLPDLTKGIVTKATQTQRITKWVKEQGVKLANLQADTVEKTLERLDLPEDVKSVLTLRQDLGRSSTAKYQKIVDLELNGIIHDNLRYYGANTGRWSGMGFQLLNLPRSKVKDAVPILAKFHDLSIIEENPVAAAKTIVRQMIKAPEGKMICAADYTAIENIGLAWFVKDEDALRLLRDGKSQYIDMASFIYSIPYDEITKDMIEYQIGKMLILGCGYGLGAKGFMSNAEGKGVYIEFATADIGVKAYRQKYRLVVKAWYDCRDAAINAIVYPGRPFKVNTATFTCIKDRNKTRWLQLVLPSGRAMYYNDPEIGEGLYGPEVNAMGINPYSKKWMRLKVIPGRFVENIIQAMSRDILVSGKQNLEEAGFKLIGSIYDEVILEVDESFTDIEQVYECMCRVPSWAEGLPLEAEGFIEKRYRKM